jgi:hypothetical protein
MHPHALRGFAALVTAVLIDDLWGLNRLAAAGKRATSPSADCFAPDYK